MLGIPSEGEGVLRMSLWVLTMPCLQWRRTIRRLSKVSVGEVGLFGLDLVDGVIPVRDEEEGDCPSMIVISHFSTDFSVFLCLNTDKSAYISH